MNRLNAKLMIQARMPVVPFNYLQLNKRMFKL